MDVFEDEVMFLLQEVYSESSKAQQVVYMLTQRACYLLYYLKGNKKVRECMQMSHKQQNASNNTFGLFTQRISIDSIHLITVYSYLGSPSLPLT